MTLRRLATLTTLLFFTHSSMNASQSGLHPIDQPISAGTIEFTLRDAARAKDPLAIECVYQPHRERDVIKRRSWHLLGSAFRIGSGLTSVQREEFHSVRQEIRPTNTIARFTVDLRDPDAGHPKYQLASVRIVGGRLGTLEFKRWFPVTPGLDPGFGLTCTTDRLGGTIRPSGLGAPPLAGALPLWPTLRTVDLTFTPIKAPVIQFWDASAKLHSKGWRQSIPQQWPGGSTVIARNIAAPTVWRVHEYLPYPTGDAPTLARPTPPPEALPGVALEIFWPDGNMLEFPEVRFEPAVDMVALPAARLSARARELLVSGTTLRPGLEHHTLSAAEWEELEALAVDRDDVPIDLEMKVTAGGDDLMQMKRSDKLTEPWLILLATGYDNDKRYSMKAIVVDPKCWTGLLPE